MEGLDRRSRNPWCWLCRPCVVCIWTLFGVVVSRSTVVRLRRPLFLWGVSRDEEGDFNTPGFVIDVYTDYS